MKNSQNVHHQIVNHQKQSLTHFKWPVLWSMVFQL